MRERLEYDRCPSPAELLCAREGELSSLSSARRAIVLEHLRRCERCRDWQQHIDKTVDDCRDYAAARGGPEQAVSARTAQFQQEFHHHKQAEIHRPTRDALMRRWLPIAAAILVLAGAWMFVGPHTVTVEAEELLERAARSEQRRSAGWAQAVRVRVTTPLLPRASAAEAPRLTPFAGEGLIADGVALDLGRASAAHVVFAATMRTLLAGQAIDWREPLSVARFRAWRQSLSRKRDSIIVEGGLIRLRTTTTDGALREVELVVDGATDRVVGQTMVFEDIGRVELEAVGQQTVRTRPAASPEGVARASVSTTAKPATIAGRGAAPAAIAGVAIPQRALTTWLAVNFRDERTRAVFVPELVQLVTAVKRDLVALESLARRAPADASALASPPRASTASTESAPSPLPEPSAAFPGASNGSAASALVPLASASSSPPRGSSASAPLVPGAGSTATAATAAERALVRRLLDRQARALAANLSALDVRRSVMFGTRTRELRNAQAPPDWQARAAVALAEVEQMERHLAALLALEDLPRDDAGRTRPHAFNDAFERLWNTWHARTDR